VSSFSAVGNSWSITGSGLSSTYTRTCGLAMVLSSAIVAQDVVLGMIPALLAAPEHEPEHRAKAGDSDRPRNRGNDHVAPEWSCQTLTHGILSITGRGSAAHRRENRINHAGHHSPFPRTPATSAAVTGAASLPQDVRS